MIAMPKPVSKSQPLLVPAIPPVIIPGRMKKATYCHAVMGILQIIVRLGKRKKD